VIFASGLLGMAWRRFRGRNRGVIIRSSCTCSAFGARGDAGADVHPAAATAFQVLRVISLPVLAIYPLATTVLGLLINFRRRREQISRELKESEERLRLALAAAHHRDLRFQHQDGSIVTVSDEFARMLEYDPASSDQLRRLGDAVASGRP
jgi:PAS domain-containing protein